MKISFILLSAMLLLTACSTDAAASNTNSADSIMSKYYFPAEEEKHEGTWLIWPHHYTYGIEYREEIEDIWLEMTDALHTGENIHIISYNEEEKQRITKKLINNGLNMEKIDFVIVKSDDVWSRDTGPMFVIDENGKLCIADFTFDGWGKKTPYENDDKIPQYAAQAKHFPIISIKDFVLEGGSIELDGAGTVMLCKSSVVSKNRNPEKSISQAEAILSQYLGATNFIWLKGVTDEDITDAHIDGMARFYDEKTIVTVSEKDFYALYKANLGNDYEVLMAAKNSAGEKYDIVELPMTSKNVEGLDYKGNYLNYYIANHVVLVPVYNDINDEIAVKTLAGLYTDKEIVPIDVTSLYQYGGMIHCVTQQQPLLQ